MRRSMVALIAVVVAALSAEVASACDLGSRRVNRREWRQHARIQHGWKSGDLTRGERRRLVQGQRRVHRMEWRAMRDGRFGPRERYRLEHAQDRQSRTIYRLKHNRFDRGV